jgi:hypothetical protein
MISLSVIFMSTSNGAWVTMPGKLSHHVPHSSDGMYSLAIIADRNGAKSIPNRNTKNSGSYDLAREEECPHLVHMYHNGPVRRGYVLR